MEKEGQGTYHGKMVLVLADARPGSNLLANVAVFAQLENPCGTRVVALQRIDVRRYAL